MTCAELATAIANAQATITVLQAAVTVDQAAVVADSAAITAAQQAHSAALNQLFQDQTQVQMLTNQVNTWKTQQANQGC